MQSKAYHSSRHRPKTCQCRQRSENFFPRIHNHGPRHPIFRQSTERLRTTFRDPRRLMTSRKPRQGKCKGEIWDMRKPLIKQTCIDNYMSTTLFLSLTRRMYSYLQGHSWPLASQDDCPDLLPYRTFHLSHHGSEASAQDACGSRSGHWNCSRRSSTALSGWGGGGGGGARRCWNRVSADRSTIDRCLVID